MGCISSKSKTNKAKGPTSTGPTPTQYIARRRVNTKMVQNVLLIWLDADINNNSVDSQNTIRQLRQVINTIETFEDGENCIQFLEEIHDEKACMIISGSLGRDIVPRIHHMSQVDSFFIFCSNKQYHEQWAKDWSKVKGIFTDINLICDALKQSAKDCEQNAINFSVMNTVNDISEKNLDQLDPMFMYTQILKEILLLIEFEDKHILDFTQYCRDTLEQDNKKELNNVKMLECEYRSKTPIWWYTLESFLYSMLNRALSRSDIDVIIKIGFFIGDLHRHIDELHKEQFTGKNAHTKFVTYRGQGMSKEDFEKMSKTKGGLISFNNFLSTSKTDTVAMDYVKLALSKPDKRGVLFVITVDPAQSTTPYASVAEVGAFKNVEDEILFAMHTVFRIKDIKPMDENQCLSRVELELTDDNDKDLQVLTKRIREETYPGEDGWQRLGEVLLMKLGQPVKAGEIYRILLEQKSKESKKGHLYNRLALCKLKQAEYEEAIPLYEKSIEIYNTYSPKDLGIAWSYSNLGLVYSNMGEYEKALSYYEKALAVRQQSLPSKHPDLASSYNNIGNVCYNMAEYVKALSYYEIALAIRQQSLPSKHPDLATSYNNIGLVYNSMGEYEKALSPHQKALAIRQQSLLSNHPDLAISYNNTGAVYHGMREYEKALSYYEIALAIRQQSLPSKHPDLATSYNNIGLVYNNMDEHAKALSSHEIALAIRQQSLPSNHSDLAISHNNIGAVYHGMREYEKALSYYEKDLEIAKQSLPPNHPDLASTYGNIGLVYENMGEYSKARSFYERAVVIAQQSLPANHPNLQKWKGNLGITKKEL